MAGCVISTGYFIFGSAKVAQMISMPKSKSDCYVVRSEGISVLTGGGPGIMEAANCGLIAESRKGAVKSIGIEFEV
jgi:predicted Rossmann-fold nucleotide-binding protein